MPAGKKATVKKTAKKKTAKKTARKKAVRRPTKSPAQIKKAFRVQCLPFVHSARSFADRLQGHVNRNVHLTDTQITQINQRIKQIEKTLQGYNRTLLQYERIGVFDADTIFFFRHGLHSEVVTVWSPLNTLKFYNKKLDLARLDRAHDMISKRKATPQRRDFLF